MPSLLIPEKVVLRLVDTTHAPLRVANVLFMIHTFANRKNDLILGPFATDADGVVTITKRDLLAEASAHYDSGLMDYDAIDNCQPIVEIAAMEPEAIEKALVARTKVWTALLRGESGRWTNIEELRNLYRTAANKGISVQAIRVRWDCSGGEFSYAVTAGLR
ncbi:MAG: hypothetical protein ABSE44_14030 [Candidatus Sulfotelmatobacter sp.]|jgi:Ni2+-binding GTPase involved in maturation of urease and hydrogenase